MQEVEVHSDPLALYLTPITPTTDALLTPLTSSTRQPKLTAAMSQDPPITPVAAVAAQPLPTGVEEADVTRPQDDGDEDHHHQYIFKRLRRRLPPPSRKRLLAVT